VVRALGFVALPANALTGVDKARRARRRRVGTVKSEGSDDYDEQHEDGDQINLSGIVFPVTLVADFPAHDFGLPAEVPNQCVQQAPVPRTAAMRISRESAAARRTLSISTCCSGCVDAAPAPEPPWRVPSRAGRSGQRHVVDSRRAPGLAAQQPRQGHPSAAPQTEALDRLIAIARTGRQMPAVVTDQRRQRMPVNPDQRAPGVARQAPHGAGAIRAGMG